MDEKGCTYLTTAEKDLHTKYGFVKAGEIKKTKPGELVESNIGKKFRVLHPNFIDFMEKAKRGPQTISLKDCGLIAAYTGVTSGSRVVDAGTGSGLMAMFLAHIVDPEILTTYEIREDFAEIAKSNFEKFSIKNIKLKLKSIYEGIEEKNLDLVVLDLPEPWIVVEHVTKSLKVGAYLVSYSPSINQSKKFYEELKKYNFTSETLECVVRNWDLEKLRPHTRMLAHTGFITIARFLG